MPQKSGMPNYTFRRKDGSTFDRSMSIAERDVFVVTHDVQQVLGVVHVMAGMPEYRSPVDGRLISSRQQRRDDLDRNNCREWDPADSPTKGKIRNHRFAKKHGLTVSEEYRDAPQPESNA